MGKIIIIILLLLAIIPVTIAEIDCQVSTDNSTWINISAITYAGCEDETNGIAYIQNLNQNTTYYIRCNNASDINQTWGYISQTTQTAGGGQGVDEKMIAFALIYGLLILIFVLAGVYGLWTGARIFQLVGFGVALIELMFAVFIVYLNELGEPITPLMLTNFYWLLGIFAFISLTWIILFVIKAINPAEDEEEKGKKWQGK